MWKYTGKLGPRCQRACMTSACRSVSKTSDSKPGTSIPQSEVSQLLHNPSRVLYACISAIFEKKKKKKKVQQCILVFCTVFRPLFAPNNSQFQSQAPRVIVRLSIFDPLPPIGSKFGQQINIFFFFFLLPIRL